MPDWFYRTVSRPLLYRLPARTARAIALGFMGRLARLPLGGAVIDLLGHMRPDPRLAANVLGVRFSSAVGLGPGLDPQAVALPAFARFGVGFLDVGPIGSNAVAPQRVERHDDSETIAFPDPGPPLGLAPHKAFRGTKVRLEHYLPLQHGAYINLRNHRKLLVIDGREAFSGGMNISDHHLVAASPPATAVRDMHFCVQGPVVADLQRAFLEDWYFVTGERLDDPLFFPALEQCGNALVRCISDGPDKDFRKLEQIIIGALSCAKEQVSIMTPYFIPDRSMTSALVTTALRGVDVRIVLPGFNNLPFVHWASRSLLWELLASGIRVYYQPAPFVHTKLLLVDHIWALVGSANLDTRSLRLNFELNMSVFDANFAVGINRHFDQAIGAAREITLQELEQRPLPYKLRDNFARLFSPYL